MYETVVKYGTPYAFVKKGLVTVVFTAEKKCVLMFY